MADIAFYHLETQGLEVAMPKLLDRVYSSGLRSVVRISNPELLDNLSKALWTYEPLSFLPHGSKKSGRGERQPIYLTTETDNPNEATILLLVNDAENVGFEAYDRCLLMFEGHSEQQLGKARECWKIFKDQGHKLTYWQQNQRGGWEKKMET